MTAFLKRFVQFASLDFCRGSQTQFLKYAHFTQSRVVFAGRLKQCALHVHTYNNRALLRMVFVQC